MGLCGYTCEKTFVNCSYEIKDDNEIQIINDRYGEINSKIKIINENKNEKLIFKKNFKKIGLNSICFIIEGKISNMSYMFNNCSTLKRI